MLCIKLLANWAALADVAQSEERSAFTRISHMKSMEETVWSRVRSPPSVPLLVCLAFAAVMRDGCLDNNNANSLLTISDVYRTDAAVFSNHS